MSVDLFADIVVSGDSIHFNILCSAMLEELETKADSKHNPKAKSTADEAIALILQQAGKSADEVAALSTLDDADQSAENQFSGDPPTITSLFGTGKAQEFHAGKFSPSAEVAKCMGECLDFLMSRKKAGTLCDNEKMLFQDDVISGLAKRGFFGLAIPKQYGGSGAKLGDLGPLLRALTFVHPDLAVMFEVHNFLGPVTPILDFGTEEQKQYFLPKMAKGELLGSFALTEPGVGADPSKLSMTATLDGDEYILDGVKWPITNVIYGGVCILVVKLKGHDLKPGRDSGMIIFEVPKSDNANFRMKRNDLVAFDYLWNARFRLMECRVPKNCLLGPPGKGLAQAFSSLAKGRGGIGVNSAAKTFKLLAHIILDPNADEVASQEHNVDAPNAGGWTSFRSTFGKPIGNSPRIQTWVGRAATHGLAGRVLGDLCFRLAANGVRDETQGMIAKVYATKGLLQTAINCYQIQGGRSVHTDELRKYTRASAQGSSSLDLLPENPIENYIGENMHEFTIATVYEGPNPVLADVGAPNAMTRSIRSTFLEPIGIAEVNGSFGLVPKFKFGWFIFRSVLGSWFSRGDLTGVDNLFPEKARLIRQALKRNRVLGRRILLIIARYQKSFMDQSFLLGDEGGIFDQLCHNLASLCFALSLDKPNQEYLKVAHALDLEAGLRLSGRPSSAKLQTAWAEIGGLMMDKDSQLHRDLIADIDVAPIPLDPRFIEKYI
jgi:alkylation response protein AidB-like acyl-CoA dehydrogenase